MIGSGEVVARIGAPSPSRCWSGGSASRTCCSLRRGTRRVPRPRRGRAAVTARGRGARAAAQGRPAKPAGGLAQMLRSHEPLPAARLAHRFLRRPLEIPRRLRVPRADEVALRRRRGAGLVLRPLLRGNAGLSLLTRMFVSGPLLGRYGIRVGPAGPAPGPRALHGALILAGRGAGRRPRLLAGDGEPGHLQDPQAPHRQPPSRCSTSRCDRAAAGRPDRRRDHRHAPHHGPGRRGDAALHGGDPVRPGALLLRDAGRLRGLGRGGACAPAAPTPRR